MFFNKSHKSKIPAAAMFCLFLFITAFIYSCSDNTVTGGTTPAELKYDVYVGSRNTHSVKKYNGLTGEYLGDFITAGSGGLNTTQDLLFLSDSVLLVTGLNNTAIKKYNGSTGGYISDFSTGYNLDKPTKMSIGPDNKIYVSQWGVTQNKIVRFTITGNFVDEFTETGVPNGLDHVWDSSGNLYAASFGNGSNGKVYKFDTSGHSLGIFINTGNITGPSGIWFGSNQNFFAADWTLGKVLKFDSQGQFISEFITGMVHIEGFAFEPNKNILLCDWTLNTVNRYDSTGNSLGVFTSEGNLSSPNCIALKITSGN